MLKPSLYQPFGQSFGRWGRANRFVATGGVGVIAAQSFLRHLIPNLSALPRFCNDFSNPFEPLDKNQYFPPALSRQQRPPRPQRIKFPMTTGQCHESTGGLGRNQLTLLPPITNRPRLTPPPKTGFIKPTVN